MRSLITERCAIVNAIVAPNAKSPPSKVMSVGTISPNANTAAPMIATCVVR